MSVKFRFSFLILFCVIVVENFSTFAQATEIYETVYTIRALGMGGVLAPYVNDGNALFANPAGLSKVKGINWELLDLNAGLNGLQIYQNLKNVQSLNGINSLSQFYGKNIWVGIGAKSVFYMPHFAFGAYDAGTIDLLLTNPAFPVLNTTYINDLNYSLGGSFDVGITSFGFAFKRVTRTGGVIPLGPATVAQANSTVIQNQVNQQGNGYGFDLGMNVTVPVPMSPTFSMVWRDVGSTSFIPITATAPTSIKDNFILGYAMGFNVPGLEWTAGIEADHLMDNDQPIGKKLHMGTELGLPLIDLRAGFYQGYTTYGLGLDILILHFDLATWTAEEGVYPGQMPDARIAAALSIDVGFDPDFNLDFSGKGAKRKVKQRR